MKAKKKEIDYENILPEDLTGEEGIFEVKLDSKATAYCTDCRIKMEPAKLDVKRGDIMVMNVNAYKCPKCGKELLDIETASRIEREFALRNSEEIKGYEVKISSDGRNYLIRFPKELSKMLATKKFAKILPVDADEFVVKVV
ncbi:MAG: YgiT-type zinc finger protein [Euryarchaeota archaeon]|nr:YgiT-type zinc finger protein [Euryarchaeota archaeon]MBU4220603.1 YgiT-type zinc finger protein [Euryarchaeota archaeon]MCG2736420.1 YgiT-type zinc finger protein [Candidatus Methanoperedenaceae archaeon]